MNGTHECGERGAIGNPLSWSLIRAIDCFLEDFYNIPMLTAGRGLDGCFITEACIVGIDVV